MSVAEGPPAAPPTSRLRERIHAGRIGPEYPATMHVAARCVSLKAPCLQAESRICCTAGLLVWKMR
jgi:hypothetical protein